MLCKVARGKHVKIASVLLNALFDCFYRNESRGDPEPSERSEPAAADTKIHEK